MSSIPPDDASDRGGEEGADARHRTTSSGYRPLRVPIDHVPRRSAVSEMPPETFYAREEAAAALGTGVDEPGLEDLVAVELEVVPDDDVDELSVGDGPADAVAGAPGGDVDPEVLDAEPVLELDAAPSGEFDTDEPLETVALDGEGEVDSSDLHDSGDLRDAITDPPDEPAEAGELPYAANPDDGSVMLDAARYAAIADVEPASEAAPPPVAGDADAHLEISADAVDPEIEAEAAELELAAEAALESLEDAIAAAPPTAPEPEEIELEAAEIVEPEEPAKKGGSREHTPPPAPPPEASAPQPKAPVEAPPPPKAPPEGAAAAKPAEAKAPKAPAKRKRPWYEDFFSDDYLRTVRAPIEREVARECDYIERTLGLAPGATILDVGCGLGLHAVELTMRGYLVVGLDLSLPMLSRAADEAQDRGLRINFLHGDMREMTFDGAFDGVLCWGTSFGYFDDEANRKVIQRMHHALRPGGRMLLDVVNRDHVIRSQPNLVWFEGDGCICMEETGFNYFTSRLEVSRNVILDDGKQRDKQYSIRLYSLHEIGQILHQSDFRVIEVSGSHATPGVYFGADSPRMTILAERRAPEEPSSPPPPPPQPPPQAG